MIGNDYGDDYFNDYGNYSILFLLLKIIIRL
ncbi:hypothetical protein SAMN06275492_1663 [Dethiosulfovibrio salsuginis]|uniref:Uncharacterized protein n=1 Tax=Dethiosulfovibrio salsuginis TaxID=561720 RepID=A0A1X7LFJ0_9BACT|nr:hypothetical protein SAMN06275492_1663 [Dethiosulfovibrio salsuginis]